MWLHILSLWVPCCSGEDAVNNIVLIEVKGNVWTVFFADGTTVVVVR